MQTARPITASITASLGDQSFSTIVHTQLLKGNISVMYHYHKNMNIKYKNENPEYNKILNLRKIGEEIDLKKTVPQL